MGKKSIAKVQSAHSVPLAWLALSGEMQERWLFCFRKQKSGNPFSDVRIVP
ncbi:MAG: hypothetical protein HPY54_12255 [Chthonomonadetes bacterium]|jgi:hypothetical protein|nr:hypothetical protein [Chthonomonadetes bacterium]